MGEGVRRDLELLEHLVVALEDLDGVPALLLLGHVMYNSLLNMGKGVLHRAGEAVQRDGLAAFGGLDRGLGSLHRTVALESGDGHDAAPELPGELLHVDLIAVFSYNVHHVHGQHHRDAELRELGGEIEVALQVRAVDDVQNGVGALADQVVSRDHLLQRVGGQGIDARQVRDRHIVVLLEPAFLFFHRDAGPVADELVGAGQGVEQGGFAAVRVACQRDTQIHNPNFLSP